MVKTGYAKYIRVFYPFGIDILRPKHRFYLLQIKSVRFTRLNQIGAPAQVRRINIADVKHPVAVIEAAQSAAFDAG